MDRVYCEDLWGLAEAHRVERNLTKRKAIAKHVDRLMNFNEEDTYMRVNFQRLLREARKA